MVEKKTNGDMVMKQKYIYMSVGTLFVLLIIVVGWKFKWFSTSQIIPLFYAVVVIMILIALSILWQKIKPFEAPIGKEGLSDEECQIIIKRKLFNEGYLIDEILEKTCEFVGETGKGESTEVYHMKVREADTNQIISVLMDTEQNIDREKLKGSLDDLDEQVRKIRRISILLNPTEEKIKEAKNNLARNKIIMEEKITELPSGERIITRTKTPTLIKIEKKEQEATL